MWIDSGGQGGWHDPSKAVIGFDEMHCRTVGYLIEDTDRGVCVVSGYGNTGMYMDSVTIPRVNVISVTKLRKG